MQANSIIVMKKILAVLLLASLAAASCEYLDVSVIDSVAIEAGETAAYPVTLTNTGLGKQFVSLYASCPSGVSCSFDPQPSYAELEPTESTSFNLLAAPESQGEYSLSLDVSSGYGFEACDSLGLSLTALSPQSGDVEEPFTINVKPETLNASGWAGDRLEFTVRIQNNLFDTGYAEISLEGAFEESTHFSSSMLTVPAKDYREVKAFVQIPAGTPGGFYDSSIRVRTTLGGSCCEEEYFVPLHLCVFAKELDLELLNEPIQCIDVEHGSPEEWEIGVRNDGRVNGPFNVFIEGPDDALEFITVSPTLFEVVEGDKQYFTVSISPDSGVVLDRYHFSLGLSYLGFTVFQEPFCVDVSGVENFSVDVAGDFTVRRCRVETIPFTVTNTGSLEDDYQIELEDVPGMLVQAVPSTFSLTPGESRDVELVLSTSLYTSPELGEYDFKLVIRSPRLAKRVTLPVELVSSEYPGESFLSITEKYFRAAPGVPAEFTVRVQNDKEEALRGVRLFAEGLGASWHSVETGPQDVPAKGEASYSVMFSPPAGAEPGARGFELRATAANGESVRVNASLEVTASNEALDFSVSGVEYYGPAEDRQVVVSIIVTNQGPSTVSGVKPASQGFAAQPSKISLEPGESKSMVLSFNGEAGARVPIRLTSSTGSLTDPVEVEVAAPEPKPFTWLPFAIIALIALFAAYAWYARKGIQEEKNALQPPKQFVEDDSIAEERLEKFEEEVEDKPEKEKKVKPAKKKGKKKKK
jgi:uncharacterized membrane protein